MRFLAFLVCSFFLHTIAVFLFSGFLTWNPKIIKETLTPLSLDIQTIQILPRLSPSVKEEKKVEEEKKEVASMQNPKKRVPIPLVKEKVIDTQFLPEEVLKHEEEILKTPVELEKYVVQESLPVKAQRDSQEIIFQKIQEAIMRHKNYPKRAQREGLEGEVKVRFIWSKEGLRELKVFKPSAHLILNEYTLKLIQDASREFPIVVEPIEITLPVGFNLL